MRFLMEVGKGKIQGSFLTGLYRELDWALHRSAALSHSTRDYFFILTWSLNEHNPDKAEYLNHAMPLQSYHISAMTDL